MQVNISTVDVTQKQALINASLYFLEILQTSQKASSHVYRYLAYLCLALSTTTGLAEESSYEPSSASTEIHTIIQAKQHPYLQPANFTHRAEDLDALYKQADYQLLWLGNLNTEKNITDALSVLANAGSDGLNKDHYDTAQLQEQYQKMLSLPFDAYKEFANFDTALSLSLLRYLHDLHYGRVDPQGINFELKLREKKLIDLPSLIYTQLNQQTVSELPHQVEPKLHQYQQLKTALAQYRELASKTQAFQLSIQKPIRVGEPFPQAEQMQALLIALGDLPKEENSKFTHYTDKLANGIKKFQHRHGLATDGTMGKTTIAELNQPLAQRLAQIELAMERLRWLPELSSEPSIIVNIPAFQLWAFDNINDPNANVTTMRVVVGKAMKNQTPVLMANMSFIDFSPYWNVPYNIVKNEIIPKLNQNGNYLNKENMELVSSNGINTFSEATISQLKQGTVRIRQRPGKKNALGKVKFLFPNKNDVYMHDTPSNALFSRSRRDFSHGCVRVSNPETLAEFVLKNQKGWDKDSIHHAMQSPKMQRVILKKSIPVLFFYTTAYFDQDNTLIFYPDIYEQDNVLQEALKNTDDLPDQVLFVRAPETNTPPVASVEENKPEENKPEELPNNTASLEDIKP